MKKICLACLLLIISIPSWSSTWSNVSKVEWIRAYPVTTSADSQGIYELNDVNARAYSLLMTALTSY